MATRRRKVGVFAPWVGSPGVVQSVATSGLMTAVAQSAGFAGAGASAAGGLLTALAQSAGFAGAGGDVVPQDPLARFGSSMKLLFRSTAVATSGSNVTAATDLSVSALNGTPTGTVTVLASDPTPGGRDTPSIVFGTTASRIANTLDRVGPTTQPFFRYAVIQMNDWVASKRIIGNGLGNNNNQALVQSTGSPGIAGVNSSGGNPAYGAPLGQWMLVMQQFCGASTLTSRTQDWISIRGLVQAGVNFGGAGGRTGCSIGGGAGMKLKEFGEIDGVATDADIDAIIAHVEYWHGSDTVRVPLASSTRAIAYVTQSNGESEGVTDSVGPGFTHTVPLLTATRTSATADRNTCPLLLRRPKTWISTAPIGKWGYEQQCVLDLVAGAKVPRCVVKTSYGSTDMTVATSGTAAAAFTTLTQELAGQMGSVTKFFVVIDRGNTDAVQAQTQATYRTRFNDLAAKIATDLKAVCPLLVNAGIYFIFHEINTATSPGAASIPAVNAAMLQAISDLQGLGYNAQQITTSDLALSGDATHYANASTNTIGSRDAAAIAAAW